MTEFTGFPTGKVKFYRLPEQFYSELLPAISDLDEMKVTLYALWAMDQLEGDFRYLLREDISSDELFMKGMGADPQKALDHGLQGCLTRGILLSVDVPNEEGQETLYFINSPRGRAAVQAVQQGDWHPEAESHPQVALQPTRPNIYRLYEEHIGLITPMIAETLTEAEQTFPPEWIEDAIRIAVENNVRRWRYVEAILRSWQEEGRHEQNRRDTKKDRRRYIEGEFADFIEH